MSHFFIYRYAYHLRKWALEGKGIGSHSAALGERLSSPIRIVVQSGSCAERCILEMFLTGKFYFIINLIYFSLLTFVLSLCFCYKTIIQSDTSVNQVNAPNEKTQINNKNHSTNSFVWLKNNIFNLQYVPALIFVLHLVV